MSEDMSDQDWLINLGYTLQAFCVSTTTRSAYT